jgi:hypothetical protein
MTTHKQMRADLDSAFHTLTHPHRKVEGASHDSARDSEEYDHQPRPRKHFHAHELHDGSYHVEKDHGEGPMETGSANDLDEAHDALEEMLGSPNEGAEHGQRPCSACSRKDGLQPSGEFPRTTSGQNTTALPLWDDGSWSLKRPVGSAL